MTGPAYGMQAHCRMSITPGTDSIERHDFIGSATDNSHRPTFIVEKIKRPEIHCRCHGEHALHPLIFMRSLEAGQTTE